MSLLQSRVELITPEALEKPVCRDKDDDWILATALSGKADCIITGDKDLLALKQFQTIPILGPGEFWHFEMKHR